jgi:hypothetical protein
MEEVRDERAEETLEHACCYCMACMAQEEEEVDDQEIFLASCHCYHRSSKATVFLLLDPHRSQRSHRHWWGSAPYHRTLILWVVVVVVVVHVYVLPAGYCVD